MASIHSGQDEEQQAFLRDSHEKDNSCAKHDPAQTHASSSKRGIFRTILEVLMALTIVGLLVETLSRSRSRKSPVPDFPLRTYTFAEDPKYLHEGMFASEADTLHTLHNWLELSADGRGYVKIEDSEFFGLDQPYRQNINATATEGVYMMSVFHQLHCLSYLAQHYQTAFEETKLPQEVAHHSAHCFDYLRQGIMCAADTSLEGQAEDEPPGWGSKHMCKDYDMVLEWANQRTAYKWRNGLLPDDSVL